MNLDVSAKVKTLKAKLKSTKFAQTAKKLVTQKSSLTCIRDRIDENNQNLY